MALRLAARSVLPAVRRPVSRAFASDVEKYGHIPTDVEQQAGRRKMELENEMKGEVRHPGCSVFTSLGGKATIHGRLICGGGDWGVLTYAL